MRKSKLLLPIILLIGLALRLYGINWDQGFHLHPDERMLIMVAERIHFFNNFNPNFFNYGSLPIYLLKGVTQLIDYIFFSFLSNYQGMLMVGRMLAVLADVFIIVLVYKTSLFLFKQEKLALIASFFYAICFFPIQNSHFFVVDVFLNLFLTLLIYQLLQYLKKPNIIKGFQLGIIFAAAITTKITPIIFLPIIYLVLLIALLTIKNKPIKNIVFDFIVVFFIFNFSCFVFSFLFMPYAFINFPVFFRDVGLQLKMNNDAYIFPYTLQYVDTLPYFYYLKNIFLWGLGPIISILCLIGFLSSLFNLKRKNTFSYVKFSTRLAKRVFNFQFSIKFQIIFVCFYIFFFLIIGRSAVKFMRYMLPLYPFFAILAGYGLYQIQKLKIKSQNYNSKFKIINTFNFLIVLLPFTFLLLTLLWTLMFVNIYSQTHTRIAATNWILKNIPAGSTIATEHWDDALPLKKAEYYKHEELTLYDQPDDEGKWMLLNDKLKKTDYIVISSNRLYIPLQKLGDCNKYKSCYPATAEYYKKLFDGKLGFKKVAEFAVYPKLEIGNPLREASWKLEIRDDVADESFTVYDHPKVLIFKKE